MIGKMDRRDIAIALGVSISNLKRAFRGTRLAYYNYCTINPGLVRSVNKFYEDHTQKETSDHFGLSEKQVDHIVNRYKMHLPKQIRWTDEQIVEAAKMAGLISFTAQAKYFNRPRANAGSIKSLWNKRFGFRGGSINGMVHFYAKELVSVKDRYIQPIGETRYGKPTKFKRLILWIDMENFLKPDVPKFICDAIKELANFQRWLWQSENPKPLILKMIKEREIA